MIPQKVVIVKEGREIKTTLLIIFVYLAAYTLWNELTEDSRRKKMLDQLNHDFKESENFIDMVDMFYAEFAFFYFHLRAGGIVKFLLGIIIGVAAAYLW